MGAVLRESGPPEAAQRHQSGVQSHQAGELCGVAYLCKRFNLFKENEKKKKFLFIDEIKSFALTDGFAKMFAYNVNFATVKNQNLIIKSVNLNRIEKKKKLCRDI